VTQTLRNWAGTIEYTAESVTSPVSLQELQAAVSRASRARVLGSRHSFSTIADTTGTLISLERMPGRIEVDSGTGRVRVEGPVRYAELARALHAADRAVPNLASLPHISVAGACATATHGSGDANGTLATSVAGLELVTASGDVVTLDRDSDPEALRGAAVGLGALGAVHALTLDTVPTFDVGQVVYEDLDLQAVEEQFDTVTSAAYSVSMFTAWRRPCIDQVWLKRRLEPAEVWDPAPQWLGGRLADGPRHPVPGMPEENCTAQRAEPGPWFERLPHFRPEFTPSNGEEIQSEYLVPRRHALKALRALGELREHIAPVLQISEIRTIAADELWMSPAFGTDIVGFHFTWVKDEAAVLGVLDLLERRLADFEARPHWGKLFTLPASAVRPLYPRLADFDALARRYDPLGVFRNDFIERRVFGE
jgi:alditol oxidase